MEDLSGWRVVGGMRSYSGRAPFARAPVIAERVDGKGLHPYAKCSLELGRGYFPTALTAEDWESLLGSQQALKFRQSVPVEEQLYLIVLRLSLPNRETLITDLARLGAVAHREEDESTFAHALVVRHPVATGVIARAAEEMRLATHAALEKGEDARLFSMTFMCMEGSPGHEAFALRALALDRAGDKEEMDAIFHVAFSSGKHPFHEQVVMKYGELKKLYRERA